MAKWRVRHIIEYEVEAENEGFARVAFWRKHQDTDEHDELYKAETVTVEAILSETPK